MFIKNYFIKDKFLCKGCDFKHFLHVVLSKEQNHTCTIKMIKFLSKHSSTYPLF